MVCSGFPSSVHLYTTCGARSTCHRLVGEPSASSWHSQLPPFAARAVVVAPAAPPSRGRLGDVDGTEPAEGAATPRTTPTVTTGHVIRRQRRISQSASAVP